MEEKTKEPIILKPIKLWAKLGISDEKVVAAIDAHWAGYQPFDDSRIRVIQEIFGATSLREVTLRAPFLNNAMKILAHLDTMSGVIVLAHELGGKSQTLHYLEGLCHTIEQLNPVNFLVIRISLSDKTTPPNFTMLLSLLEKHILSSLVPLCRTFLKKELKNADAPDFPDPCYKPFDAKIKETVAEFAFYLLDTYEQFDKARTEANFWPLYEAMIIFLKHPQQELCYSLFLVDEAGEGLSKEPTTPRLAMLRQLLDPLKPLIAEQASCFPRFSVVFCGSTSMSKLKYVTNRYCRLDYFNTKQCNELWDLWKKHATKTDEEKEEAEKWICDLSASSEEKFEEALFSLTDGVPGYLVELFCDALGIKPPNTLAMMVERHYRILKAQLVLENGGGTSGVLRVIAAMKQKSWGDFAEHGLAPSPNDAPSAPVTRILFELIRKEEEDVELDSYGTMLTAMANLKLSGSFERAVYEEKVRFQFLRGSGFRVTMMSKAEPPKKKTKTPATKPWTESEVGVMFNSPAKLVPFDGMKFSDPISYSRQIGGLVHQTSTTSNLFLFVPQSQTFPSIDMSIAQVARRRAKKGEKGAVEHVDLYHVSVSISPRHFATFVDGAWSKAGHLPLDLNAAKPTILRSPKARAQLKAFRKALEAFPEFEEATLNHHYAVVDDKATDLGSLPTSSEFHEDFYVFQLM